MILQPPEGFLLGKCVGGLTGRTLVFAGEDSRGQPCALKTLDPSATSELVRVRFAFECKLHARARDCTNVLPLVGPQPEGWLVTAWAHSGDLDHILEKCSEGQPIANTRAIEIVRALLIACIQLHERGIIHRDIKPSNVLLDGNDVWLADFGIAASQVNDHTWRALPQEWTETSIGSPDWAAPELLSNTPNSQPANDVYGIGAVWQAMANHFARETLAHARLRSRMLCATPSDRPSLSQVLSSLAN